jgi:protein tyrosine/serine phosphatase
MWKIAAVTLVALLAASTAIGGKPQEHPRVSIHDQPMANYGVIWEHKLTRSGMPRNDTGWRWLHDQGVKSIVTFRKGDVDYGEYGFTKVLSIPLSKRIFPTERQAQDFLGFIQDPKAQPVHIHCKAGKDRTGMMAALARYAVDGWPLDKALAEARSYRGGESLDGNRVAWLEAWAAKHPPGSARLGGSRSLAQ